MSDARALTVIIPAYEEEQGLPATLQALLAEPRLRGCRVVVVDDGSRDGTAAAARATAGVHLLQHPNNRGYGAGIKTGTRWASTEYVAWYDADGQHRPEDLASMFETALAGGYDAVFGNRTAGSAVVRSRVVGKKVLALLANRVAAQPIPDINCGLRVLRRHLLEAYLPLLPDGFSASTTTTLLFLKRNRHCAFHPVVARERVGRSTVQQGRDGLRTIHLMLRILFLFSALRSFGAIAAVLLSTGLVYGFAMAIVDGRGFPVLASLVTMAGVMMLGFGIVSDQISALRIDLLERSDVSPRAPESRPRGEGSREA